MISLSVRRRLHQCLIGPPAHERLRAGLLGAAFVWIWVIGSDWISGVPFRTTTLLGRAALGVVAPDASVTASALAFAVVHCGLWTLVATLLLLAVQAAERTPSLLIAATVVFILLQLAITGLTTALSQGPLGVLAWRSVFIGNALGWLATITYIARWHPELRTEFAHADAED